MTTQKLRTIEPAHKSKNVTLSQARKAWAAVKGTQNSTSSGTKMQIAVRGDAVVIQLKRR